jgi:Flp pilus assembly pilin Flp
MTSFGGDVSGECSAAALFMWSPTFVLWTRGFTSLRMNQRESTSRRGKERSQAARLRCRAQAFCWLENAKSMFGRFWQRVRGEDGQGVSEYAVLLVLLVLIVVAAVHALGTNAQQVIDRVNTALHG